MLMTWMRMNGSRRDSTAPLPPLYLRREPRRRPACRSDALQQHAAAVAQRRLAL
jgi:hypothetical protein